MKISSSTRRHWLQLAFRVYFFSLYLALRSLVAGQISMGLKLLVAPVGYWRFWPNAIILGYLGEKHHDILDVSSPKILSLLLARDPSISILATDLDDANLFRRWVNYAKILGLQNYRADFQDARSMNYPDASFDFIYSISVLEHIDGNGDTEALREFARLLRPGGVAVIEVPYRRHHEQIVQNCDSKGLPLQYSQFYERHYDMQLLDERLRIPELDVTTKLILGERLGIDKWIATTRLPRFLRLTLLPLEPLFAALNYWVRTDDAKGNPLAAMLIYRKP